MEDLFNLYLQHAYGLTECSPGISVTRIDAPRTDVSAGPIYPGIEVKLVGPDLQSVPDGEVGELWVRGPNVMKGYYKAPEETAKVINSEGWFNTQDLAKMENENLFVVGRKKDLIIRFGFNVYPSEVEGVFNMHPEIARSAVIGPTSEETGEQQIVAFVQPRPGSTVTSQELDRYGARHLAFYKRPTRICLVSDLPQTPSGKIAKAELAKSLESEFKLGNKTATGAEG